MRVYTLWTIKLTFDSRSRWDGGGLTDPRVVHLWDPQDLVGNWFVNDEPGNQASSWDTYLLFGPTARWTSQPPPLISSGSTVIATSNQLAQSITPLLKDG